MKKDRNNDRAFEQFKNLKIVQLHNKKHEEQLLRSIYARKDKPTRLFNIFSFNPVPVIAGIIIVIIIGAGLLWWLPPVFFPNDLQAQGSVYIEESNGNRNITEVSKIRAGMDIRTLRDGRLNWKLNEKSRVVLHKNTELKITELRQSEESWQSRFDLQKGSIDCQITLPGKNSRFIILTPVLEITVTGTRFSVTVDDAGNSTVSVEKGKVLCNPFYNLSRQLEADQDISADKKSLLKQLIKGG
ncbi:MAG: FecR family protein [Spirochaetia bacterium]